MSMLACSSAGGVSLADYLSSESIRPAAIVQPAAGPSPNRTDPRAIEVASWMQDFKRAENTLFGWLRDPSALEDDETNAPSRDTIRRALSLLRNLAAAMEQQPRDGRLPPPPHAVTVGSGGAISLEFVRGQLAITFVVNPDASLERMYFLENRLRYRDSIPSG